jgi:hypothetical protein
MDPLGLNSKIDFEEVTYEFDNRIEALKDEWFHRVEAHMDRNGLLPSLVCEMRLMRIRRSAMYLPTWTIETVGDTDGEVEHAY